MKKPGSKYAVSHASEGASGPDPDTHEDRLLIELELEAQTAETSAPAEGHHQVESDQGLPSPDALVPWRDLPLAPIGRWGADPLGPEFQAMSLQLRGDSEGPAVATLVRLTPGTGFRARRAAKHRKFAVLYLHGRNDYFFQEEAARRLQDMGGAFYALDLRKYGRSLRPWQTIGYADDLDIYDEELTLATNLIRQSHPDIPLILMGHSTGGLIGTLWAWRNPREVDGLILNSAWLELQSLTMIRPALQQVVGRLARLRPRASIMGASKIDSYYRSIKHGWAGSELELPPFAAAEPTDPAVVGWDVAPEWKLPYSYPAPAAWMNAVLKGHAQIEKDVKLHCPVLSMTSTSSHAEEPWGPWFFETDVVLNAELIVERSAKLGDNVTIERFPGKHDLLLSDPTVRQDIYGTIERWLTFAQLL